LQAAAHIVYASLTATVTTEAICERFGEAVASIVSGVTDSNGRRDVDNQRDLLLAMSSEWRVVLVKLADRLHNMRTLGAMPVHKQVPKKRRHTLRKHDES